MTSERKIYASSFDYFAKSNGAYDYYDYKEHQTYIDAIANINKHFGKISLLPTLVTAILTTHPSPVATVVPHLGA